MDCSLRSLVFKQWNFCGLQITLTMLVCLIWICLRRASFTWSFEGVTVYQICSYQRCWFRLSKGSVMRIWLTGITSCRASLSQIRNTWRSSRWRSQDLNPWEKRTHASGGIWHLNFLQWVGWVFVSFHSYFPPSLFLGVLLLLQWAGNSLWYAPVLFSFSHFQKWYLGRERGPVAGVWTQDKE